MASFSLQSKDIESKQTLQGGNMHSNMFKLQFGKGTNYNQNKKNV